VRALVPTAAVNTILGILLVSAISLVGVFAFLLPALRRHGMLLVLVAFAAGTLLGDSFFHLLPEGVEFHQGFPAEMTILVLGGFLVFFLLEGVLRWGHAHGEEAHPHLPHAPAPGPGTGRERAVAAPRPIPASATAPAPNEQNRIAAFAWTNLVGDGLHNFVDGTLIAASFYVSPGLGVATTVAVAAHEIPQELGDFAVLLRAGLRPAKALFYNFLSALLALLGGILVIVLRLETETLERFFIPFIAGGFIYIAAADLVPELHHHTEGKFVPIILVAIASGMALMAGLLLLE
jgi:zinc and cadmium transporter